MTSSSITAPDMETSQDILGNSDLVNQSAKRESRIGALTNLWCLLYSWVWSKMCVAVFCQREVRSSVPVSYRMGSWKWVKKAIANNWKSKNDADNNSMNHFVALPISVLGNSHSLAGSSPVFPLNLGISIGILTGTGDQAKWCLMGSFVNFDKSGNSRFSRNGSFVGANGFWVFCK